jgi:hypothetical protein
LDAGYPVCLVRIARRFGDNPTVAFESSPDDFLTIVSAAAGRAGPSADALLRAAEDVPQDGRVYWDRDI